MTDEHTNPVDEKSVSCLLICKSGAYMVRMLKAAPETLVLPVNAVDTRLFLDVGKNEVISPFSKLHFKRQSEITASGFTTTVYEEVSVDEFDPTGLQEVKMKSLETISEELNEPKGQ